jgi:hypothetical protein
LFVPKLQDAFVPANSIMAGRRFSGEEEIDSLLEGFTMKICQSFHLERVTAIFSKIM